MLKTAPGLCDITIQDPSTWLLTINDQRKCTIPAKEGEVLDFKYNILRHEAQTFSCRNRKS